ncbi:hypothetical protein PIB30_085035 [Stylosanthes scabra]|uniref:Exocyst subunit Exo70 family protein n=1 Tax=Stylosanthes scabra TaxID=79078 RepID=A0ABU6WR19_9FABA|nr:hypothetical protein [Stylosanthes scabra]
MDTNQVKNFLIQKKLWRLVGFLSTPIALLCFALSSSFKQVFGEWNLLKILIYVTLSSIICTIMLLAHKFHVSRSRLLKAQVSFLGFMLTSCSSFLYGQKVNGKPDMFSLVSSVAFALMSLSLSRQIDFGFEVDLFNFFLGYFLVQLMTIHIALASLGASFCYLLMFLRSYLDTKQPAKGSNVSHSVAQIALKIEDRRSKIRKAIFEGGCDEECYNVYITWRRQILDEKMKKIELHKLHIKEIKGVPLDYLQRKIQRWIMAFEYSISILFSEERNLTNSVFLGCSSSSNYADLCFMELCRPPMTLLLDFASAVAKGKGLPLRLLRLLKVFEALKEMLPEIETLFSDQSGGAEIRDMAIGILARLREAIKGVFADLENLICKNEPSIGIVHGGGIHPITHYIMNYLGVACNNSLMTLEQVFESNNNNSHDIGEDFEG